MDITVKGRNFVNTGPDWLLCKFEKHERGDDPSRAADDLFNVTARFVADDTVVCHVPDFTDNTSVGAAWGPLTPPATYRISISPNGGRTWSGIDGGKENATVTFRVVDQCPLFPAIPEIIRPGTENSDTPVHPGENCDNGCNKCPCSCAGDCVHVADAPEDAYSDTAPPTTWGTHFNESLELTCVCFDGFNGTNCEICAAKHWGITCQQCPFCEPHGECQEGKEGDGTCNCDMWWMGSTCSFYYKNLVIICCTVVPALVAFGVMFWKRRIIMFKWNNRGPICRRRAHTSPADRARIIHTFAALALRPCARLVVPRPCHML
eukprot:gene81-12232_t